MRWTIRSSAAVVVALVATLVGLQPLVAEDSLITWSCLEGADEYVVWKYETGVCMASPVLHQGNILVGAGSPYNVDPPDPERPGLMLCLNSGDGKLLWQARHPKLPVRTHDMLGACSKAAVDGDRVYYQSNRGELMCVDLHGFQNGNDGPYKDETRTGPTDADLIWKLDMIGQLGIYKRDAGDVANPLPCPLVMGDLVFSMTGNGANFGTVPKPDAPSFLAVDKHTGRVIWTSSAPGEDICYGQWSSPVAATVNGQQIVIFPAGDGRLYAFEPRQGKLLWKVDCNEPGAVSWKDAKTKGQGRIRREGFDFFVAVPTVVDTMLYAGLSHEYEMRDSKPWPVMAVDLKQAAAGKEAIRWKFADRGFFGTFGSVVVDGDLVYVLSNAFLFVLERSTGKEVWRGDMQDYSGYFASPTVHQQRVYVGTEDGYLYVFAAGRVEKCLGRYELGEQVTGTPIIVGNTLYITTINGVWALRVPKEIAAKAP